MKNVGSLKNINTYPIKYLHLQILKIKEKIMEFLKQSQVEYVQFKKIGRKTI